MSENKKLGEDEIDNRFALHPGSTTTIPKHRETRKRFIDLANYIDETVIDPRAKALALTALQESAMWSNFGIALEAPAVLDA